VQFNIHSFGSMVQLFVPVGSPGIVKSSLPMVASASEMTVSRSNQPASVLDRIRSCLVP
jgi:hypothetical protein